jgi:hypothetical protein
MCRRACRLTSLAARKGFGRLGLEGLIERILAEVSRNRTDRPDKIGTAGFEAPDGHQPACTSGFILDEGHGVVNLGGPEKTKGESLLSNDSPFGKSTATASGLRQGQAERYPPVAVVHGVSLRPAVGLQVSLTPIDARA